MYARLDFESLFLSPASERQASVLNAFIGLA